ncbi:MAG TPA: YCF48-related protein [Vicinamibacterales bacterium]|nr:YCF48-related protein [Vicinamibacterales bacterium]
MRDSQDRDAAVDRWLRRASAATPDVSATATCLDPEVMAAWIEGRLSGAALAGADAHVAGCARCQAIAGTIARTESIAQWARPERQSPWRWLTWAVPLTAAATIATVVLVEWRRSPQPAQSQPRADAPGLADQRKAEPAPAQPLAAAPATKSDLKDDAGRLARAQEKRLDARDSAENERASARAASAKATPPTSVLAQKLPDAASASRQRPAEQKLEQKPAAPARAEELDRVSGLGRANEGTVLENRSPAPTVRWRVTGARVERSVDAGSTWSDVPTGVAVAITAGAAPTSSICWLAGRGGMVLLTADGGGTWQRVPLTEATDLSAIRATDARNATVTTADGREYATTDGGRTWVRRELQEIRTAPF